MTAVRVWAPRASNVELVTPSDRVTMIPGPSGWHEVEGPELDHGVDYAFSLDGGPARPDPRSPWQPEGVHGPSRRVDHRRFEWTDTSWAGVDLDAAIFYELHVGTFTEAGTFDAAIARLDHLVALGINVVELLPVAEFPGRRGWGYDGVDLWAPHHAYGGPDGLKRLVDACHGRGLAVVLDVVYNHLGPAGNYLGEFGSYFTDRYQTPWGEAVNLDGPGSDEVRRFFIDNALMWLGDYHVDGLRLDAVHAIFDFSAVHFLEKLAVEVEAFSRANGRRRFLVAESDLNDPRLVRRREEGGYGLDAQWSDDFHHALHVALTGERQGYYADFEGLPNLAKAATDVFVFTGQASPTRGRAHGRPATGVPASRFLAYAQNHDQVGNRARGDRLSQLVSLGRLKVAAALVLTSPFLPLLFQGEEWGAATPFLYFTDHADPDLARAVSEGRRREFAAFGWAPDEVPDPQDPASFTRSKLRWDELGFDQHAELLDWHQRLIALRRKRPELRTGHDPVSDVRFDDEAGWLALTRGPTTVACNVGETTVVIPAAGEQLLLGSDAAIERADGGIALPPDSAAIVG